MPTILLALPTGETVRNVLRTDIYTLLRSPGVRLVVLTAGAEDPLFQQEFAAPGVEFLPLPDYRPTRLERALQSVRLSLLRRQSTTVETFARSGSWVRWVSPVAEAARALVGGERMGSVLRRLSLAAARPNGADALLDSVRPDVVVVSRVLSFSADYPVLAEAARQGVPVIALCASWDNLTSKGFFPFGVHRLVVWNRIMQEEAVQLFGFPPENVYASGIPRFDAFFRRDGVRSRAEFLRACGLDPDRRLITYTSGHDRLFWPHEPTTPEPEIAAAIADAMERGELGEATQLIIRLHPQAQRARWEALANRKHVHLQVPGRVSSFQDRDLSNRDNQLLAETLLHSDVVVNIASTITIDAAVFDTPIVCVRYDARGERPYAASVRRFYDFDHYRKLCAMGGFRIADSRQALLEEIRTYLHSPERDADGRRRIVEEQCLYTDGRAGERVGRYVLEFANRLSSGQRQGGSARARRPRALAAPQVTEKEAAE